MHPGPGDEARIAPARAGLRVGTAVAAVVVAFFLVRLLGEPWPKFPPTYPDSFSYLKVAARGPLHPHFFFDERPIGYPLFLWSLGRSSTLTVVAQTAVYIAAFWTVARVVFSEMRSRAVGVLAVIFIAAIAIEPRNAMWNTVMLSESLSTSFAVLSIALWWRAAARPSKRTITWAWVGTAAWILVRDTNVLPTLVVIVPAVLGLTWATPEASRAFRRRLAAGAAVIVVLCGYVYISQAVTLRNQYPVNNNIGLRVLPDASLTKWFAQGGMPLDDALRARTSHNSWDDGEAFLRAPNLARYRSWARGAGSRRLFLSMVLRWPFWWNRLHHELPNILHDTNQAYDSYGVFNRFPQHLPPPLGEPRTNAGLWGLMLLAAAGLGAAALERRRRLLVAVAAVGLLSAFVEIWASYAGDAMEVNRHLVGPLARLNVLLILAIALGADAVVARFARQSIPLPVAAPPARRDEALAVAQGAPTDA
jgi:hypothetical protein